MVFFVCEGCNESMKKNQVDKHASRCRSCHAVTCVDSVSLNGQLLGEVSLSLTILEIRLDLILIICSKPSTLVAMLDAIKAARSV